MVFVWNEGKNRINRRKHGVSFETATTLFSDLRLLTVADLEHSAPGDERWFSVGLADSGAMLSLTYQWTELSASQDKVDLGAQSD